MNHLWEVTIRHEGKFIPEKKILESKSDDVDAVREFANEATDGIIEGILYLGATIGTH